VFHVTPFCQRSRRIDVKKSHYCFFLIVSVGPLSHSAVSLLRHLLSPCGMIRPLSVQFLHSAENTDAARHNAAGLFGQVNPSPRQSARLRIRPVQAKSLMLAHYLLYHHRGYLVEPKQGIGLHPDQFRNTLGPRECPSQK
jgi:hypothetical protein